MLVHLHELYPYPPPSLTQNLPSKPPEQIEEKEADSANRNGSKSSLASSTDDESGNYGRSCDETNIEADGQKGAREAGLQALQNINVLIEVRAVT